MSKKKRTKPVSDGRLKPALMPDSPVSPKMTTRRRTGALLTAVEWLSLAGVFIFMLHQSWLRWMDPLVDFPRDLYLAWRVSEGDLLYKEVANWYGPLAQLAEGAGFHVFGVGIDTVVWMNIALTVGVVCLIWGIFGALGNRLSRWLCVVVFVVVFALGQYTPMANYNFIAPYVAQSTYGFAGLVLLLWALLRHLKSARRGWLGLAGLGLAIAYLDKPEPLLASVGTLAVFGVAEFLGRVRKNPPAMDWRGAWGWAGQCAMWLAGGFFSLWLPVFLYFLYRGGLAYALLAADYVPHTVLDARFQDTVVHSPMTLTFFGWDEPWQHFFNHVQAGAGMILVLGSMLAAARWWAQAAPGSPARLLGPVVIFAAAGVGIWMGGARNWMDVGEAFVFPVMLMAIAVAGWSWWAAWQGRAETAQLKGLAIVGTAAALMLARMVLHGRIYQFGFFMMPLGVLFVIHLMVGEAAWLPPSQPRARGLLAAVFTAMVLLGVTSLAGVSLRAYAQKTATVGEGRDRFYAFPQDDMQDIKVLKDTSGALLDIMIDTFRKQTPNAKTLVVFPEGIAVNYHLRVRSSLAELEFHPVALGYVGLPQIVEELSSHPPEAIYLHFRDYRDFNEKYFGDNDATGRPLMVWIAANYERAAKGGRTQYTATGNLIDLLRPKPHPAAQPAITESIN